LSFSGGTAFSQLREIPWLTFIEKWAFDREEKEVEVVDKEVLSSLS
jgi:hypothetical protein